MITQTVFILLWIDTVPPNVVLSFVNAHTFAIVKWTKPRTRRDMIERNENAMFLKQLDK